MLYFLKTKLNYTEEEFWRMSLRKYVALRDKWIEENTPPEQREVPADFVF